MMAVVFLSFRIGEFADNGIGTPLLQSGLCESVTIKRSPFKSQEDAVFRAFARVGSDARMGEIEFVEFLDIHIFVVVLVMQRYDYVSELQKNCRFFFVFSLFNRNSSATHRSYCRSRIKKKIDISFCILLT